MKFLIVGSRSIADFDFEGVVPHEADLIISGGGACYLGRRFARYTLYGGVYKEKRQTCYGDRD